MRLETYTSVNTVKSVATAVRTRRMAPKMIPLLLKANGSERTPPPVWTRSSSARDTHVRSQRKEVPPCLDGGKDEAAELQRKSYVMGAESEGAIKMLNLQACSGYIRRSGNGASRYQQKM